MTMADTARFVPISNLFVAPRAEGAIVCTDSGRDVTWADFSSRVGGVTTVLANRPEHRWLIATDNAIEFCTSLLGILHAGKRAIIAPNLADGTLRDLAAAYDASIGSAATADIDCAALTACGWTPKALDPNEAVLDLFTSGSAGVPKRVSKCLRQLDAEVLVLESCWGAEVADAYFVSTVPHHHIYGMLFRLLWPLCAGRRFDLALHADPATLLHAIERHGKIVLVSSPTHLSRMPELLNLDSLRNGVRRIFSSGAPLPAQVARRFYVEIGQAPVEVYGSTETGGIGWRQWSNQGDSLWTPFPGIEFRNAGAEDQRLRSPYLEEDEAPIDDRIESYEDGRFRLGPRLDRVVKVEGKRVSLPDMECHLCQHAWIQDCAVMVIPRGRDEVCAAAVLRREGLEERLRNLRATTDALRDHLRAWYDPVVLPKRWRFVEALPVNARGKVSAPDLRALFDLKPTNALPTIQSERTSPNRVEFDFVLPPDLPCFEGHFPGLPVLPGVIQVDWAIRLGRDRLGCRGEFHVMENLRFQSIVAPEHNLTLVIEALDDGKRLAFSYAVGQRKCSSGLVVFRA